MNAGRPSEHALGHGDVDGHRVRARRAGAGRPRLPDRVRTYLLTFSVVDDLAGLVVIAIVYSGRIDVGRC